MKKIYIIEVVEPNRNIKINDIFWKQRCNFSIEVLKINTCDEHKKRKKEKESLFQHG